MTEPTVNHGFDRRVTWVLFLSGVVVALLALGTPAVINASSTADEVARNDRLDACRAAYGAAVTDARTEFDIARSARDTAATELDVLTNLGWQAIFTDDGPTGQQVLSELPNARDLVREGEQHVAAATAALSEAATTYVAQVDISRTDPDGFLETCERRS